MGGLKCLQCLGEYKVFLIKSRNGSLPPGTIEPVVDDAVTMAPSWQQKVIGPQMLWACVALPTCERHLAATEVSAADRAMMGGKLLQGRIGLNDGS
jgi:hypothetical protein